MTDKDSLAAIVAELREHYAGADELVILDAEDFTDFADRIERLDAEMRREQVYVGSGNVFRDLELPDPECRQQLADANIELAAIRAHSNELSLFTERLEDELAACRLLLSLPRVRALFPPLPDGAVLGSCSGPVYGEEK